MELYRQAELPAMKTIKSVSELPKKLRDRFAYKKQQSPVDWYRDVRHRQYYKEHLEMMYSNFVQVMEKDAVGRLIDGYFDLQNPFSVANYHLPHWNEPVEDQTVHQTAYLSCGLRTAGYQSVIEQLSTLLERWEDERKVTDNFLITQDYEAKAAAYIKYMDESEIDFDAPVERLTAPLGNPLLSYGRPLSGYPVVVDTQFDDETLVKGFRLWLKKRRETDREKAKRPFNQNDFDDWAHYKIRELFDLEVWAALCNVKILDRVIADYLWPNASDNFAPLDVLRTTTRKKMAEVFTFPTCLRFYVQLRTEFGENFLQ